MLFYPYAPACVHQKDVFLYGPPRLVAMRVQTPAHCPGGDDIGCSPVSPQLTRKGSSWTSTRRHRKRSSLAVVFRGWPDLGLSTTSIGLSLCCLMIANTVDRGMPIVMLLVSADDPASHRPIIRHFWPIVVFAIIELRQYGDSKGWTETWNLTMLVSNC